ncbi:hypothetical protein OG800_07885 [Streptomyces sp. NBC_00445]|uniref:hypothetical protein n=1 Tax=Streptomyces sp. NBC_00445 TaxID=2975745 RepID=UPI002E1B5830
MNLIGRRLPRLLPFALASVLAATACTSSGSDDQRPQRRATATAPATGNPDKRRPVVAFLQPEQRAVMMADADGRTWKAADLAPSGSTTSAMHWPFELVWSPDASRLAWIDPVEGRTGQIHLLDVRSGEKTSRPCPCDGVGFLGNDAVSLSSDGSSLLLFPPEGNARRIALDKRLRPYSRLATGGTDDVTVFSPLPEGPGVLRGQGTLAVADRQGRVRELVTARQPTTFGSARRQPAGTGLAWANMDSGGACWSRQSVLTHPVVTTGAARRSLPDDAAFRHAHVEEARLIIFLAWAGDGLTVTFSALNNCQVMYPERTASYYLRDGRWTYLGKGMLGIALGTDGRVVRLEDPVYADAPYAEATAPTTGTLTLSTGIGKQVLARGVSLFSLTPAETHAARPPTAAAAQPKAGVTDEDDHGTPLLAAVRELARNIEAAAAEDDRDRLVELCDPCTEGEHDWIRSDDGPRTVLRAIRTHPMKAADNELIYPNLTECVDEPDQDISCTPQQLRDAAALGVKPGIAPGGQYGGSSYLTGEGVLVPLTVHTKGGTAQWTGLAAT